MVRHGDICDRGNTAATGDTSNASSAAVMDGKGDQSDEVGEIGIDVSVRVWGVRLAEIGGGGGDGSEEDSGVAREIREKRGLEFSLPSLSS
jgi:hypothetical protein